MLKKLFAFVLFPLVPFASPAQAQSSPWPTTTWVAECVTNVPGQPDLEIRYDGPPGSYCVYENYRPNAGTGAPMTVTFYEFQVRRALEELEFASEMMQAAGFAQPALERDDAPEGVPANFSGSGYILRLSPELTGQGLDAAEEIAAGQQYLGVYTGRNNTALRRAGGVGTLAARFLIDSEGFSTPADDLGVTLAHELFHAVHVEYARDYAAARLLFDEHWAEEGLAEYVGQTIGAQYATFGSPFGPSLLDGLPLHTRADFSPDARHTDEPEGLFAGDEAAAYDTSVFFSHLFNRQLDGFEALDAMMRFDGAEDATTAADLMNTFTLSHHQLSLTQAMVAFMKDVTRVDGPYASTRSQILDCANGGTIAIDPEEDAPRRRVVLNEQLGADAYTGLGVVCYDLEIDTSAGQIEISLEPEIDGVELSPQQHVVIGNSVLSQGDTITLEAGYSQPLTIASMVAPLDGPAADDDLQVRLASILFEATPLRPCGEFNADLHDQMTRGNQYAQWHSAIPGAVPQWGDATITVEAGGAFQTGAACMRIVRNAFEMDEGSLTIQLTTNPSDPTWQERRFRRFTLFVPGEYIQPGDLSGGPVTLLNQSPRSTIPPNPQQNQFFFGPMHSAVAHPLNAQLNMDIESGGRRGLSGTYEIIYDGQVFQGTSNNGQPISFTVSGDFDVPVQQWGPGLTGQDWTNYCDNALSEGRVQDALSCSAAAPDGGYYDRMAANIGLAYPGWFASFGRSPQR